MNRDDIQKLLGGYATGTLTPEEQQALFEAALTDQALFDALAREEALRDVLSDPAARAHLLAAIDDVPAPWYRQWWRPMVVLTTAALAIVGVVVLQSSHEPQPPAVAKVELPRFRQPDVTPSAPVLPPPPEVRRATPGMAPLKLPPPALAPPPPPPPAAAASSPAPAPPPAFRDTKRDPFIVDGAVSGAIPVPPAPQQAPRSQTPLTQQSQGSLQTQLSPPQYAPAAGNRLLDSTAVPVRGTVTDGVGARVPGAAVSVKSLATGETTTTITDGKGEFQASAAPGSTVQVSASAAGFKTATVNEAAPASGTPAPVNLRLEVGAASQTVEVTAQPQAQMTRAAGAGGVLAETRKAKTVAPAILFQLLRTIPGGSPSEVTPGGRVPLGSSSVLRVTPIADGYLRIVEDGRDIATVKVRRAVASETALPEFDKLGPTEVRAYFSRQIQEAKQLGTPTFTIAFNVQ